MILELRPKLPQISLKLWLEISGLAKSSYYEWKSKLKIVDEKELNLINEIRAIIEASKGRYGYRRVTLALRNKGSVINHKRVYRLMKEQNLLCDKFHRKSRSYYSYKGQIGKIANNELNRKFKADKPNKIWVTDVTEFKAGNKKLYLSPILDLYNSEIVSFSTSSRPDTKFTNRSLNKAIERLSCKDKLMIHSDQGFHYQHHSWIKILDDNNIKQSMSRKGNCIDNSPMENFFGLLKQEMYYGNEFKCIKKLEIEIKEYINWYNNDRIKSKLKGLSPVAYRQESIQSHI